MQELALFFEKYQGSVAKRVFVVVLQPPDEDQEIPNLLSDLLKYRFWYEDDQKRIRTLDIHELEPKKTDYVRKVEDLATDISKQLKILKKTAQLPPEPPKTTLYLAEVTDDLDSRRDQIRRYLEDGQIRVLPTRRYLEGQVFKEALQEDLKQCTLFVQLLGAFPGKMPPEIPQGYARLQLEQTQALELPILQWRDPHLLMKNVASPKQRALLEAETVYAESLESFKQRALETTTRPKPSTNPSTPGRSAPTVFVNSDGRDRPLAEAIRDQMDVQLFIVLSESSGGASEIKKELEDNLRECDAFIVVYGNAPLPWVNR